MLSKTIFRFETVAIACVQNPPPLCKNRRRALLRCPSPIFTEGRGVCTQATVATDGKDEHGWKLEKIGATFSSFDVMPAKIIKKNIMIGALPDKICFIPSYFNSKEAY